MWLFIAGVLNVSISACFSSSSNEPRRVDWENYAPVVRTRIDDSIAAKDCRGLQAEFDVAEQNSRTQRSRTGDGNADLMGYIDRGMREAGCYD